MIASCSEKRNSAADFYFRHSVCQQRSYNQLRSFSRVKEETILLQDCFVNDAHNENIGQPALELRSIIDLGISLTRLRSLKLGGWITRSFDSRALLLDTRAKCWGLLFLRASSFSFQFARHSGGFGLRSREHLWRGLRS